MSKLMLDDGHGGHDSGASAYGLKEKVLTTKINDRIQSKLKDYKGIKVYRTRKKDKYLTLTQRTNLANKKKVDAFISTHINAGGGTGFESYIYNGGVSSNTRKLQNCIHDAIIKRTGVRDRGKKRANFAVVRQTKMSAVLTENLFIDNKNDAKKLKNDKFIDKIAQGHVDGIVKYFNLKKKVKKVSNKPSKVHKKGWNWLKKQGITNGKKPKGVVTRQQFATMLYRYHRKHGK